MLKKEVVNEVNDILQINDYDYHTNKYLIRLIQILNIFLDDNVVKSFQNKSLLSLINIFSTSNNTRINHNCVTDFITFKMIDEYDKQAIMYKYVLSDNCIIEQNYRDLFSKHRHCTADTTYNSSKMTNKFKMDSMYTNTSIQSSVKNTSDYNKVLNDKTGQKHYCSNSCYCKIDEYSSINRFLEYWSYQQVSPFTKNALETFKTLVLNDLPVQCIISDHQYPKTNPKHIFNIDIKFVCPAFMTSHNNLSESIDCNLVFENFIKNIDEIITVNCPLIMYENNNSIKNLSTFINSHKSIYSYLKQRSYNGPIQISKKGINAFDYFNNRKHQCSQINHSRDEEINLKKYTYSV